MTFFLTRARPESGVLRDPEMARQLAEPYSFHQLVWRFFSQPREARDFLYRWDGPEHRRGLGTLWMLSPEVPSQISGWGIETKEMHPSLTEGDRLRFSLRVNPVVRRDGKRHDVVMDAKKRLPEEQVPSESPDQKPSNAEFAQQVMGEWLERRASNWGFECGRENVVLGSYRSVRFQKSKGGRRVQLGVCDLEGVLTIKEPDIFEERWQQGFGAGRGFGCGLMLIART